MIVGNGDIASVLNDREGALFFASGVSNSGSVHERQYDREQFLLHNQPKDLCCFYFSSISIFSQDTRYTRHKESMELVVRLFFKNYNIIRIGNIDWGDNPNTFLNFLRNKKGPVTIRDEYKYMISKEQLLLLSDNPAFPQLHS